MRHLGYVIIGFVLLACLTIGTVAIVVQDQISAASMAYLVASMFTGAIIALYLFLSGERDPFSPIMIVLWSVMLGSVLRAPYLIAYSDQSIAARFIMFGYTFESVEGAVFLTPLGVLALVVGYALPGRPRQAVGMIETPETYPAGRVILAVSLFLGVGLLGLALYIGSNGIDLSGGLGSLSSKRAQTFEGSDGAVYGAGWQLFMARLAGVPFIFLGALLAARKLPKGSVWTGMLVVSGLAAVALPFLSSSRTTLALLGVTILIVAYYFGRLRLKWLIVSGVVLSVAFTTLGNIRSENQAGAKSYDNAMDTFLGSGNGLDSYRTALIATLSEDRVPLQYGATLSGAVAFVVPRAIWPEKPNPALGPWVKSEIFHQQVRNNGWPPGIVAEGWLNASFLGVVLLPFAYGVALRLFYNYLASGLGRSVSQTLFYASAVMPLAFSGVSYNVALGLNQALFAVVPIGLFALLARARQTQAGATRGAGHHRLFVR